jgi:hypothetical protein
MELVRACPWLSGLEMCIHVLEQRFGVAHLNAIMAVACVPGCKSLAA